MLGKIFAYQSEHTEKIIPHDLVGFNPQMQSQINISKSVNVIFYINKLKEKDHMVI